MYFVSLNIITELNWLINTKEYIIGSSSIYRLFRKRMRVFEYSVDDDSAVQQQDSTIIGNNMPWDDTTGSPIGCSMIGRVDFAKSIQDNPCFDLIETISVLSKSKRPAFVIKSLQIKSDGYFFSFLHWIKCV